MATLLQHLRSYGYQKQVNDFREVLANTFAAMYPGWTDEKLTHNPAHAAEYCREVNRHTGLSLPDELILNALVGMRKHRVKA